MKNSILIVFLLSIAATACGPSDVEIQATVQSAVNKTIAARPTATPISSKTPTLSSYEKDDLIEFCKDFDDFTKNDTEFTDAFNLWLEEKGDKIEPKKAREFSDWAGDLVKEVLSLNRPTIAREAHDLVIEYAMSHADEMHTLVYYHDDPNNENYDEYTLRYSNTVKYYVHMMDVFNDLMISNNIDPVECRRFP